MKVVRSIYVPGKIDKGSFRDCGSPLKLVEACLCPEKDRESSLQPCGGLVKLA